MKVTMANQTTEQKSRDMKESRKISFQRSSSLVNFEMEDLESKPIELQKRISTPGSQK